MILDHQKLSRILIISGVVLTLLGCHNDSEDTNTNIFSGVVFIAENDTADVNELYIADINGAGVEKLSGGGSVLNFAVSPDSRLIAYLSNEETSSVFELFIIDAADRMTRKIPISLSLGGNITDIRWSPVGQTIAYIADREVDQLFEIYVVNADGTEERKISGMRMGSGFISPPQWSPNGLRLSYVAEQDTPGVYGLYTVSNDGTNNIKVSGPLVEFGDVWIGSFSWNPDGAWVAYSGERNLLGVFDLYVAAADGLTDSQISNPLNAFEMVFQSAWSPAEDRLAYVIDRETNNDDVLFTALLDGTESIQVSPPGLKLSDANAFQWSPSGTHLAYRAHTGISNNDELYVIRLDGTGNMKVSGRLVQAGPQFLSFSWSADGSRLAYIGGEFTSTTHLFTVFPDGSGMTQVSLERPVFGDFNVFEWSPTGNRLVYSAQQDVADRWALYSVFPDGSNNINISGNLMPSGNAPVKFVIIE